VGANIGIDQNSGEGVTPGLPTETPPCVLNPFTSNPVMALHFAIQV